MRLQGLPADVRFWSKVQGGSFEQCWIWTAARTRKGYGIIQQGRTSGRAHRWAYESMIGPIPDGLEIDHLCNNTGCVNPWHLEPVTSRVNSDRRNQRDHKDACKWGHPFDEVNTILRSSGGRDCRICSRARARRSEARKLATP